MWIEIPSMTIALVLGLAIGSFLNVAIYRIPAGLSILFPPSHCPLCSHRLSAADNIPVFGWLALGGKCRYCHSPISWRYPTVEAITGLLFLGVYLQFGLSWETVGYWFCLSWLLVLAMIDWDTFTLPNSLTQFGLVAGLLYQLVRGGGAADPLLDGMFGAILGLWLFEMIIILGSFLLGQAAMGEGDAKLAAAIGAWLGWKLLLLSGFLACLIGAVVGLGAIASGQLKRRQKMPFGPFLALGGALTIFWGDRMISTYIQLFFPPNLIG
nr:A24 family peptidase [Roseofilum halophilum]